jgi:hypothetical protein
MPQQLSYVNAAKAFPIFSGFGVVILYERPVSTTAFLLNGLPMFANFRQSEIVVYKCTLIVFE